METKSAPPPDLEPAACGTKVIILMKRRNGLTHDQFRAYYETTHAPLAIDLIGKFFSDYRRNYVSSCDPHTFSREDDEASGASGYDVITEIWFRDRATLEAMYLHLAQPDVLARLAADEEEFMDRASLRSFVVDECSD
jgi:hypothetical protein